MPRTPRDVTETELAILQILWERRRATRRQITDVLYPGGDDAHYATVQKLLERLEAKGYVGHERLDGIEICRRVRALPMTMMRSEPAYVLLLTGREAKSDIVAGLSSGANDYLTKPFDREELQARLRVGAAVLANHLLRIAGILRNGKPPRAKKAA